MAMPTLLPRSLALVVLVVGCLSVQRVQAGSQKVASEILAGKSVYQQHCAKCHGMAGWGDGPHAAQLTVAPRNFHDTITDLQTDDQLRLSVEFGVIATPMHAWHGTLSRQEIEEVVAYVRLLSGRGQ